MSEGTNRREFAMNVRKASAQVISIFEKREWQAGPIQLHLFDYRELPTGTFTAPKRASDMETIKVTFLSREDAAHLVGMHPRTISRWITARKIRASKIGRGYLLREDELLEDIARHKLAVVKLPTLLKKTG